jgi:hypothetical protein
MDALRIRLLTVGIIAVLILAGAMIYSMGKQEARLSESAIITPTSLPIFAPSPTSTHRAIAKKIEGTPTPSPTHSTNTVQSPSPTLISKAGTLVGDAMLSDDTVWSVDSSPYYVNGNVQIPIGVTLTLDEGTSVILAQTGFFGLKGRIIVNGASITGGGRMIVGADGDNYGPVGTGGQILIKDAIIKEFESLFKGGNLKVEIYDSTLININKLAPDVNVNLNLKAEGNVFQNVGEIVAYGYGNEQGLTFRYNCFIGKPPTLTQWYSAASPNIVNFNSIYGIADSIGSHAIADSLSIRAGYPHRFDLDARNNYWNGTTIPVTGAHSNDTIFSSSIFRLARDRNDTVQIDKEVLFLPMLESPHINAPRCED